MGFRDLEIQKVYDTRHPDDDPVRNFYVPVLAQALTYDRGTGYFSSTVLSLAARGIAGFIRNGGRMRIITTPELTPEDAVALMGLFDPEDVRTFVEERLALAIGDVERLASLIELDHLRALAWMLTEGTLDIRIVIPREPYAFGGMLHFKLGIMTDSQGDIISFSGSNNESVGGWVRNVEQIKVFKGWEAGQDEYLRGDKEMFERYWTSAEESGTMTITLPDAVKDKLITLAPSDDHHLKELLHRIADEPPGPKATKALREYQDLAIDAWRGNGYRGVLEMATGTGKTLTASKCIDEVLGSSPTAIVLVVVPLLFLVRQWERELSHLNPIMVHGGTDWRSELRVLKNQLKLGLRDKAVLIGVQNTCSTQQFTDAMAPLLRSARSRLIVVDEVHGAGAEQFSHLMVEDYEHRLGLSATPTRWFDDEGTAKVMDYFGGVVYTFGIHEALHWIDPVTGETPLCPYDYFPSFVELTESESEEYELLTVQIGNATSQGESPETSQRLRRLLTKRALVVKKARNKITTLRTVLQQFDDHSNTLVYCSDGKQLRAAAEVLDELGITYRRFSGNESAFPRKELGNRSERDVIMTDFESGAVDVLLAMKCLDEGVDIPSARRGIILASSTNPREFIQRRGRLLRRSPGKTRAQIFDVIVVPTVSGSGDESEMSMLRRELLRVEEFAKDATNEVGIRRLIMEKTWQILK